MTRDERCILGGIIILIALWGGSFALHYLPEWQWFAAGMTALGVFYFGLWLIINN